MNKFINILLGVILFPTMGLSIIVGMDLPLPMFNTTGAQLPFREEIFVGLGVLILIVIVRRSIRRWMGMRIVNKIDQFKWNQPVSAQRRSRVRLYLFLEALVMTSVAFGIYTLTPLAWLPALALIIGSVEGIIFSIVGGADRFRVGLSSKALIVADREVRLLYLKGLRKVSAHQQTIYFDYIKDLQLRFPTNCIQEDKKEEFFKALEDEIDSDRVFFSKKLF